MHNFVIRRIYARCWMFEVLSIITLVCCCWCLGAFAVAFALVARRLSLHGLDEHARYYLRVSNTCALFSLALGLLLFVLYLLAGYLKVYGIRNKWDQHSTAIDRIRWHIRHSSFWENLLKLHTAFILRRVVWRVYWKHRNWF